MDIGERLRTARQSLGLSQTQIAEDLEFSSNFLSNIEGGRKPPSKELIKYFSLKYKINANWLLTGEGEMTIEDSSSKSVPLIAEMKNLINGVTLPKFSEIESRLTAIEALLKEKEANPAPEPAFPSKDAPEEPAHREGPQYTAESEPEYGEDEDEEEYEKIPYAHDIAAGPPISQNDDLSETVSVPRHLMKKGRQYYAASIRGGSMTEAGINDGDMVLILHTDVPRDNAMQVVRHEGKSTLKLLKETEGNGWELHYRDGTGRVIPCRSSDYEVQGEFEAVLKERTVRPASPKPPKRARTR